MLDDYNNTNIPADGVPPSDASMSYQPFATPGEPPRNQYEQNPYDAAQPVYQQPYTYQPQYTPYTNPPSTGKATASLVLGIVALVFSWMSFLAVISLPCGIIGLVLGVGARKVLPPDQGRGQATAGMICSIIALAIAVLMLIFFTLLFSTLLQYGMKLGHNTGV